VRHLRQRLAGRLSLTVTMVLAAAVPARAGLLDEMLEPVRAIGDALTERPKRKAPPRHMAKPRPAAKARPQYQVSFLDRLSAQFSTTRAIVPDPTRERPGTVVVDTRAKRLYLVLVEGQALRYAIGVGREGFTWKGTTTVGRKAEWPDWQPPPQMLARQPHLPRHMPGGLDNPLGARALYLHAGGQDTMYRIHGTNEAASIGRNVSSGCIRLMNDDVVDLYGRVSVGARVVVR
jgi:lipoprotein-anchoring transpeptidase ErfK/SrfK